MGEHTQSTIFFRESKEAKELESLLRLRYKVYKKHHPNFIPNNPHGLDLDCYEMNAFFYRSVVFLRLFNPLFAFYYYHVNYQGSNISLGKFLNYY